MWNGYCENHIVAVSLYYFWQLNRSISCKIALSNIWLWCWYWYRSAVSSDFVSSWKRHSQCRHFGHFKIVRKITNTHTFVYTLTYCIWRKSCKRAFWRFQSMPRDIIMSSWYFWVSNPSISENISSEVVDEKVWNLFIAVKYIFMFASEGCAMRKSAWAEVKKLWFDASAVSFIDERTLVHQHLTFAEMEKL